MAKGASRDELAALLELSPSRIQQLTGVGVLKRAPGGYDRLTSAVAVVHWLRRDEATRAARQRLINSQAVANERRTRRQLRQLLTVPELREILMAIFENGWEFAQRESTAMFIQISAELGEDKARVVATGALDGMCGIFRGYRNHCEAFCDEIEKGFVRDDQRLDDVMRGLQAAALPAEVSEGEPENPKAEASPAAPVKRKGRRRGTRSQK